MAKRASKASRSPGAGQKRLLFPTNRANVLSVLSSGLIRPRAAYEKYYDDLLALCPGNIVLFHGSFPRPLVPLLTGDGDGPFPVLVEVDARQLGAAGGRPRVMSDLTTTSGEGGVDRDGVLCEVVGEPVPIAAVKQLHFASQEDLEDFRAREFDNVPKLPPLVVSAALFPEGGPDPEQFKATLQAVPAAAGSGEDFRRLDAAMGAIAMLSLLLPSSKPWLDALAATTSFPNAGKPAPAASLDWLVGLVGQAMSVNAPEPAAHGVDARLMAAAIDLFRCANPRDGWVESRVAADIAARASVGASPDEAKEIDSWRDIVTAVARSEKQAGPLDDSGSLVRRGLMLLVLRCQPERIMRAGDTPLSPGPQVTATAGMLSGLFHGYSRLSRDIKAQACPVEQLSRLAVCWWSAVDGIPRIVAVRMTSRPGDAATAHIAVTVDGTAFVDRIIRPSDAMMRLFYQAKGVGLDCEFDPGLNAFVVGAPATGGRRRRIVIEPGRETPRGQATIRVRAACVTAGGKPVRVSKREDALALLERNHDPVTQCRFAVEPVTGNVEVLVNQLLDTMDSPELQLHVEAVSAAADDFEATLASRPAVARKSAKQKSIGGTELFRPAPGADGMPETTRAKAPVAESPRTTDFSGPLTHQS